MVVARLKGAEKRANTRPSMMKLTSEDAITCSVYTHTSMAFMPDHEPCKQAPGLQALYQHCVNILAVTDTNPAQPKPPASC